MPRMLRLAVSEKDDIVFFFGLPRKQFILPEIIA
jgi:hypothetical protein